MCSLSKGKIATVIKSTSKNIFENLAFEEYLFRTHNVEKSGELLLIWSNQPCVVIGRHQNLWLEVNQKFTRKNNIEIARRHSGGGAVYHDLGNLNISLLTTHAQHCRPKNLKFISESINNRYRALKIEPNSRDDMELLPGNRKCSGTAARIAKGQAYHHLTLLVDANLENLKNALKSDLAERIETNATRSVRAKKVGFLREDDVNCEVEEVKETIIEAYKNLFTSTSTITENPAELIKSTPEIAKILEDLKSWQWIYGKSPKFVYDTKIHVKNGICEETGQRFEEF
ncbi:unnamed protein product [Caenorhabditis angaria]|uniref:BPL/LPL catalytic domain-containing protein n=1 Tax=Caenorhabditis angaria TaxID=860376 RepID=A0A9P1I3R6_9PELO|nr:unnamed protein product [Caenorhabditis angaria]